MKRCVSPLVVVVAVVVAVALRGAHAAPQECAQQDNPLPVYTGEPVLLKEVPHGKLFEIGSEEPKPKILHLWGTPFQMGVAHGTLLREEIQLITTEFFTNLEVIIKNATQLPDWVDELIVKFGVKPALDLTFLITEDFTPTYFYEELHGVAEGSGVDFRTLVQLHMFPELVKAQCTIVGAWGDATRQYSNGGVVQLRALDFMPNGPMQSYPVVIVYHPNEGHGHDFAMVTWAGFIGAVTGVSSVPMGLSQKVWAGYNGEFSRTGIPFHFLLRDILQFDKTVHDSIKRTQDANRTCAIFIGVSDPKNDFRVMYYTYSNVTVYDDKNYPEYPNHPRMSGLVYLDRHVQPSKDPCIATMLKSQYGKISPMTYIRDLTPALQTGADHAAIYDLSNDALYFVYASPFINNTFVPAYFRSWIKVSLTSLWSVTPPESDF